ncbi:MAG: hypothetical protein V4563_16515 [Pseudomonadota bacterium]
MNIHLHHALTHAADALTNISSTALHEGTRDLENQCIGYARDHLAKAAAELNAYDAKRTSKPEAA